MTTPKYLTTTQACSCLGFWYRRTCKHWGRMAIVDTKPFKLRVILHRIFVERPQVTGIPAWPGGVACYRRSRYIL